MKLKGLDQHYLTLLIKLVLAVSSSAALQSHVTSRDT